MWTLDGIRIFPQEYDDSSKQIIARLNPVDDETIYHVFGYDTEIIKMGAKIVGDTDLEAIKDLRKTGLSYVISGPGGFYKSFLVSSVNAKRENCISQTIRQDLACDAPVYNLDLELYYVTD